MFDLAPELIALLIGAAFVAGFIDSIAGGGGLITVPVLMLSGIPPVQALATNKVQGAFGAATAAWAYARRGLVDLRSQGRAALMAGLGSVGGTLLVAAIPTEALRLALPVILIGIALFFALKPGLDDTDRAQRLTPAAFIVTIAPAIGFYDGLVGPGAGAFYMLGYVMLAGYGILKATAHTKLLNFASNVGSIAAFALVTKPIWLLGIAMGLAQMSGALLGTRLAMRIGARVIKPLLVLTSTALAIRLIWQMI